MQTSCKKKIKIRTYFKGNLYSISDEIKARHVDNAIVNAHHYNVYQFVMFDIKNIQESILKSTGIKIAGILGTPAIKELGMVIDLSRGIVTINKNSAITVSTD